MKLDDTTTGSETLEFEMHRHLLYDVITKQAGTLDKAILEGVMNSIDAGASRVEITIEKARFTIRDNGRGITRREEIDRFFRTFGQPQETEKTYGRFRMGRGQLFAFGRNVWRTGPFRMDVDIKNKGLQFDLQSGLTPVVGCIIDCELYTPTDWTWSVGRELKAMCKYVEVEVVFNGERISRDPASETWAVDTPEYRLRVEPDESGIDIYQQGVLVETLPAYSYGFSGVVVTKPGHPLMVNFARNQVLRECPLFKQIMAKLTELGSDGMAGKKKLTAAQRGAMWDGLKEKGTLPKNLRQARFLEDTNGVFWSVEQIERLARRRNVYSPRAFVLSFAEADDRRADIIMQQAWGFVLGKVVLSQFSDKGNEEERAVRLVKALGLDSVVQVLPFADLVHKLEYSFEMILEKDWTKLEKMVLSALRLASWQVVAIMRRLHMTDRKRVRSIGLGKSTTALAWTDGTSVIVFDRVFLRACGCSEVGFHRLLLTMAHEYVHDTPTEGRHNHDDEFYRLYHELSHEMPRIARLTYARFVANLRARTRRQKMDLLTEAELGAWMERLYGFTPEEVVEMAGSVRMQVRDESSGGLREAGMVPMESVAAPTGSKK